MNEKHVGVVERVGARTSLAELIIRTDDLPADERDNLMEQFRVPDSSFHEGYFQDRDTKHPGVRHETTPPTAAEPVPAI